MEDLNRTPIIDHLKKAAMALTAHETSGPQSVLLSLILSIEDALEHRGFSWNRVLQSTGDLAFQLSQLKGITQWQEQLTAIHVTVELEHAYFASCDLHHNHPIRVLLKDLWYMLADDYKVQEPLSEIAKCSIWLIFRDLSVNGGEVKKETE